jgi:hypothetical protein
MSRSYVPISSRRFAVDIPATFQLALQVARLSSDPNHWLLQILVFSRPAC